MVGSAVETMVWSSAASSMPSMTPAKTSATSFFSPAADRVPAAAGRLSTLRSPHQSTTENAGVPEVHAVERVRRLLVRVFTCSVCWTAGLRRVSLPWLLRVLEP